LVHDDDDDMEGGQRKVRVSKKKGGPSAKWKKGDTKQKAHLNEDRCVCA
jgi:hypothetical protein